MNRFDALSHLMSSDNREGAFLIRLSETGNVGHVLSGEELLVLINVLMYLM